ncbi:toll/interleukin-1 receptor domain-containing protein [Actinokineospora baliensis]|uniref:toll/interleukin-1 receptor domain-containing protein n=1 Tax=Actinokineospora baliensis TaxID=547056 RepID=UPI0027DCCAD5|nr:toll/interleukin-1 receptor domain-containing protein [Actinokineospora baliensis]
MFVSYAHDSTEHEDDVRFLARLLVAMGIDVVLDQWEHERHDWSEWVMRAIYDADHVIVIASPRYVAAANGNGTYADRTVVHEAKALRDRLVSSWAEWTTKILPVVFPQYGPCDLPDFLTPSIADYYTLTELSSAGVEDLVRVITKQPKRVRPAVGGIPHLPPEPEADLDERRSEKQVHRGMEDYAADVSLVCLRIRSYMDEASRTTEGWGASARRLHQFHDVLKAGWHDLSAVPLPTGEDDRRSVRHWQEAYLRLVQLLDEASGRTTKIAKSPLLALLPGASLATGWSMMRANNAYSELSRRSTLLGIANPTT